MFEPLLKSQKSIYKVDCQCFSEIEYLIQDILPYCDLQECTYRNVDIIEQNYNQFLQGDTIYYIRPYNQNRNIKFVSLEQQGIQTSSSSSMYDSDSDSSHILNELTSSVSLTTPMSFTYASNYRTLISEFDDYSNVDNYTTAVDNYTSDDSNDSSNTSNSNTSNSSYDDKNTYTIYKKIFSNSSCNIVVYGIYQNDHMIKTFVLFDNVSLFKYFYKEPYLYDMFQSIIGHYNYIGQDYLEKNKMYYFYKINHLERYVIKLHIYQLNQGRWCSWNAETNIILGLDLTRPFYIIQFLENIDDKQEKIYIDILNRHGTTIDDRVMLAQNIFGKEFSYPRQSISMQQQDQGVIIETSEGCTRQFLW